MYIIYPRQTFRCHVYSYLPISSKATNIHYHYPSSNRRPLVCNIACEGHSTVSLTTCVEQKTPKHAKAAVKTLSIMKVCQESMFLSMLLMRSRMWRVRR